MYIIGHSLSPTELLVLVTGVDVLHADHYVVH